MGMILRVFGSGIVGGGATYAGIELGNLWLTVAILGGYLLALIGMAIGDDY